MTDDMIERVSRALRAADFDAWTPRYYQHMARAAIEAMREPTDSMTNGVDYRRSVWMSMIDVALGEKQ